MVPSGSLTSRAPRWRQTLKTPWALPSSSPMNSRLSPAMSRVTNAPREASGCAWPTQTQPPRKRCSASQAATSSST